MRLKKVEVLKENQPTRYYSKRQEKRLENLVRVTKNSGATLFDKGDVISENILFECKTKVKPSNSITIQKDWLEKNKLEAIAMDKQHSILAFNFGGEEKNYYILDEETMLGVLNLIDVRNK